MHTRTWVQHFNVFKKENNSNKATIITNYQQIYKLKFWDYTALNIFHFCRWCKYKFYILLNLPISGCILKTHKYVTTKNLVL